MLLLRPLAVFLPWQGTAAVAGGGLPEGAATAAAAAAASGAVGMAATQPAPGPVPVSAATGPWSRGVQLRENGTGTTASACVSAALSSLPTDAAAEVDAASDPTSPSAPASDGCGARVGGAGAALPASPSWSSPVRAAAQGMKQAIHQGGCTFLGGAASGGGCGSGGRGCWAESTRVPSPGDSAVATCCSASATVWGLGRGAGAGALGGAGAEPDSMSPFVEWDCISLA